MKTVCQITIALILLSIMLAMVGMGLNMIGSGFGHSIYQVIPILTFLLITGGFLIFLTGLLARIKQPMFEIKTSFVLGGLFVLLGALISIISSLAHIKNMHDHFDSIRFALHVVSMSSHFLSSLCLSIFIFRHIKEPVAAKGLAAITTVLYLIRSSTSLHIIHSHTKEN